MRGKKTEMEISKKNIKTNEDEHSDNLNTQHSQRTAVRLAKTALMVAVACIIGLLRFPIVPGATFLTYDFSDIPALITGFAFGPISGLLVLVVTAAQQAFLLGGDGIFGFIMHVAASGIFILVASCIYKANKSKKNALIGMIVGTFLMVGVMLVLNYYVTPYYFTISEGANLNYQVIQSAIVTIMPVILVFNLVKGIVVSVITFCSYKKVSPFMHR